MLAKREHITVSEATDTIDSMVNNGWYYAPNLYTIIVQKLETLRE